MLVNITVFSNKDKKNFLVFFWSGFEHIIITRVKNFSFLLFCMFCFQFSQNVMSKMNEFEKKMSFCICLIVLYYIYKSQNAAHVQHIILSLDLYNK